MFGVGIFVTFAQRYKLSGTTGIARGLPLKLTKGQKRVGSFFAPRQFGVGSFFADISLLVMITYVVDFTLL